MLGEALGDKLGDNHGPTVGPNNRESMQSVPERRTVGALWVAVG